VEVGGETWVVSRPGGGTTLSVILPLAWDA
jgi:signal transduction histidine kinase